MPNYSAHIGLACEVASLLKDPGLDAHLGTFFLGSTAPDIRIITRRDREEYHFMDLDATTLEDGVRGLFEAYPGLADSSQLSKSTQVFVAGYVCHLVMDQAWIVNLYRPYFGNQEVFEDPAVGKVMDRALQLELDRVSMDDHKGLDEVMPLLSGAEDGVDLQFIPADTLVQWREWVEAAIQRGFTWERLRFLSQRRQDPENFGHAQETADQFLESVPEGLKNIYRKVPNEKVHAFKEQALQESARIIGGYLP